jgi:lipoprotein-anchoring transpeptidase ErfK/SrfK
MLVLTVVAALAFAFLHATGRTSAPQTPDALQAGLADAALLPTSPPPAFAPAKPKLLDRSQVVYRWAPVVRRTAAHSAPSPHAPIVSIVDPRTPEGTTNIVAVLRNRNVAGALWVQARLAVLPNKTVGWIPRSALGGYQFVKTRLVVDIDRLTAALLDGGKVVFRAPVAVGQGRWPTPTGTFYVREKLTEFSDPFYGPVAFGTSARSAVLTDWPSGGFVGIHGTNEPNLIPGRVSHGCVRMRNADILRLGRLMPVGTPVTIR